MCYFFTLSGKQALFTHFTEVKGCPYFHIWSILRGNGAHTPYQYLESSKTIQKDTLRSGRRVDARACRSGAAAVVVAGRAGSVAGVGGRATVVAGSGPAAAAAMAAAAAVVPSRVRAALATALESDAMGVRPLVEAGWSSRRTQYY